MLMLEEFSDVQKHLLTVYQIYIMTWNQSLRSRSFVSRTWIVIVILESGLLVAPQAVMWRLAKSVYVSFGYLFVALSQTCSFSS